MQYISQLNLCAPLLPVNLSVNVRYFYNSVGIVKLFKTLLNYGFRYKISQIKQKIKENGACCVKENFCFSTVKEQVNVVRFQ